MSSAWRTRPVPGPARAPAGLGPHRSELDALVDRGGAGRSLGWPPPSLLLPDAARKLQRPRADRVPARAQASLCGAPHHPGVGRAGRAQEPSDAAVSRARPDSRSKRLPGYARFGATSKGASSPTCARPIFLSSAGPCARASHASVGGRLWPSASCDTRGCRSDMIFTLFHETH